MIKQNNYNEEMKRLLDIGIALTTEKDYDTLLDRILMESMEVTVCDAGALYIYEEHQLCLKIKRHRFRHICNKEYDKSINLPPVKLHENNIFNYAILHNEVINIENIYQNTQFDFRMTIDDDIKNGYHTESMMVFPLLDHENKTHGVIQLINAMENGKSIPFAKQHEHIVYSLACQAAVTLANLRHFDEMKATLLSMAEAFTTAIDERTPYNANHTKNVSSFAQNFMKYANKQYYKNQCNIFFEKNEMEQITLAAMLHDIGKMTVPLSVMNKETRLGIELKKIEHRFDKIRLLLQIDYLKGYYSTAQYEETLESFSKSLQFIHVYNQKSVLTEEDITRIIAFGKQVYKTYDGIVVPYLTQEEQEYLCVKKGTLTKKERVIMEHHVVTTTKILSTMHFAKEFNRVLTYASEHHEYLDGTGYPNHKTAKELSCGSRLLTMMDIFDSLISQDRPYKKPMSVEQAFCVLNEMALDGKLDMSLVSLWKQYIYEMGVDKFLLEKVKT